MNDDEVGHEWVLEGDYGERAYHRNEAKAGPSSTSKQKVL